MFWKSAWNSAEKRQISEIALFSNENLWYFNPEISLEEHFFEGKHCCIKISQVNPEVLFVRSHPMFERVTPPIDYHKKTWKSYKAVVASKLIKNHIECFHATHKHSMEKQKQS